MSLYPIHYHNPHRLSLNRLTLHILPQAQDTPDNSLFSFVIGDVLEEEETSSIRSVQALTDDAKAKLKEILNFLGQDLNDLIHDAEPIRSAFKLLRGQLPELVEEALILAAYIENRQIQFLKAKRRLADRSMLE